MSPISFALPITFSFPSDSMPITAIIIFSGIPYSSEAIPVK
jgi:hypothetical protein